jgi:polysaccharide chain length determinant protein (PEP-CTERM system associated)
VHEYQEKLAKTEEALKQLRASNVDARPGSEAEVSVRINQLQSTIEQTERQVRELEVRKTSIERQLAGEAETASALSREDQYRARISELRSQLETLRLSYHDSYPDIVRIKNQIEDLKEAAAAEQARRSAARNAGQPMVDESVLAHSPVYLQLRQQLLQTRTEIDTLNARITEARKQVRDELARGQRVASGELTFAELTRDYQVTRDLYQDLLRRRENARVSMNMDSEQQGLGLTFRINEPPSRPSAPKGPQYIHIAIVGLVLSLALPFGAVFALVKFDPRIRLSSMLEDRFKLPVLARISQGTAAAEMLTMRLEMARLGLAVGAAFVAVVVVIVLRATHVV